MDSPVSLSTFIAAHHEEVIREFAEFAETLMPAGAVMSNAQLRDHAEELLTAIVLDMSGVQSLDEQSRKSRGLGSARTMAASGELHADARLNHGFSLQAVLAEFRALRATVLRLYAASGASNLDEVRRFDESVDEALTVSINRYAARTDRFRDQFIGILSHDLRNPLGAIATGAALLAVPEDHPQRRARVVTRILNSADRMQRLIADLLDLTQARLGGAIRVVPGKTDLQSICEEVVLEMQAAHPAVELRFDKQGDLSGEWDADRLSQVVSNLLGNAIQHGAGSPVTVAATGADDRVVLSVHNGGPPIPPEAMAFIFEPLARGQSEEQNPGHSIGLGLFIAQAIISAHGGAISVCSTAEHGTTFEAQFPRRATPKPAG